MWAATEFSVALSEIHGRHVSSLIRADRSRLPGGQLVCPALGASSSCTTQIRGLKVEKLQFDHVHTCFNALSCYSIVAWRVLCLALGRLVNLQPTKKQPLPGVKLPGQALVKLQHMAEAF